MMHMRKFLVGGCLAILLGGCDLEDEQIPSYIHMEPWVFTAADGEGGTTSKITEAWVYVGEELLGAYTLPATFPVLASGELQVRCDPGIYDNGLRVSPELYPFYNRYSTTVTLTPGEVTNITPVSSYDADVAEFRFLETFETGNSMTVDLDNNGNTAVLVTEDPNEVRDGARSGVILLDADNRIAEVAATLGAQLPQNNLPVYIEMDYKSDASFLVGLYGVNADGTTDRLYHPMEFFPKSTWNKVYINFTTEVQSYQEQYDEYKVLILGALPDSLQSGRMYLDNIKLITQKQ